MLAIVVCMCFMFDLICALFVLLYVVFFLCMGVVSCVWGGVIFVYL